MGEGSRDERFYLILIFFWFLILDVEFFRHLMNMLNVKLKNVQVSRYCNCIYCVYLEPE